MPPQPEPRLLEELPEAVARITGAIPTGAVRIATATAGRQQAAASYYRDILILGNTSFQWRFYLEKRGETIFLFAFRQETGNEVLIDLTVNGTVVPLAPDEQPRPATLETITWRIVRPPLLVSLPPGPEFDRLKPAPDAIPENTVVLRVGPGGRDRLAVMRPEDGTGFLWFDRARIRYVRADEPDAGRPPYTGMTWPVGPFLALVESVQSWVGGEFDEGVEAPFRMPAGAAPDAPDLHRILLRMGESYIKCMGSLQRGPSTDELALLATAFPQIDAMPEPDRSRGLRQFTDFGVIGYGGDVMLRLNAQAQLAALDEKDPFTLQMLISFAEAPAATRAQIRVRPPDFLVSGKLYNEFLKTLKQKADEWAALAGLGPNEASTFVDSVAPRASVFRIRRDGEIDTDAIVLPGRRGGEAFILILTAVVRVDQNQPDPVREMKDFNKVYPDPAHPGELGAGAVEYFLRLIVAIRNWTEVLR